MPKPSGDITKKRESLMTMVADMAKSPSKFSEVMLGHKLFKYNAAYADSNRTLVKNSDFLSNYIIRSTQTEMWIQWLNKGGITKIFVRATGETGVTLRGYSPHVIIADECAFIKRSIMVAFLPSGMATQANVWLTSTPFGKQGYFYESSQQSRPKNPDGLWKEFHVRSVDNPRGVYPGSRGRVPRHR